MQPMQRLKDFSGNNEVLDISHWLRTVEMLAVANAWTEEQKLCNACASLTGSACFWLDSADINDWSDFKSKILERFGDNIDTLAQRLYNCKQKKNETVNSFTDRFRTIASRLAVSNNAMPATMLLSFYTQGLHEDLRDKIILKHPHSLDQAVTDAKYFEESYKSDNASPAANTSNRYDGPPRQNRNWQNEDRAQPPMHNRPPPRYERQERSAPPRQQENRPPAQRQPGPRNWPPKGHAQQEMDDINREMERLTLKKAQVQNDMAPQYTNQMVQADTDEFHDPCMTESYGAYSHDWYGDDAHRYYHAYEDDVDMPDAGPIANRRPRNRVGFDPAQMPRRAPPAMDGPRAAGPPRPIMRPAAPPQAPRQVANPAPAPRRTARTTGTFQIADQLQSTAAKLSIGELLRIAPQVRAEAKAMLDRIDAEQQQPPAQNMAYESSYVQPPDACMRQPTPANVYKHQRFDRSNLNEHATGISVVKAPVRVASAEISAIVDSGASHTMMSDVLARKLQLYKNIIPTQAKFYTSSGRLEKPVGRLVDVPVTVGGLTLPVDVYVSSAHTYSLLLGNNFLAAAEAQIHFGTKELVYRKDLNSFEAIPISFLDDETNERMHSSCSSRMEIDSSSPAVKLAQIVELEDQQPEDMLAEDMDRMRVEDQQEGNSSVDSSASHTSSEGDEDSDSDSVSTESSGQGTDEDRDTVWDWSDQSDAGSDNMHGKCSKQPVNHDCLVGEAYAYDKAPESKKDSVVQPAARCTDDWMFDSSKFAEYAERYGPFHVDACANDNGDNAHLPCFWSPSYSCLDNSWTDMTVFCNPPWRLIQDVLQHFLQCRKQNPEGTHAVFVLPNWPWQPWYPLAMQHFDVVDYFPSGSQLFTAPNNWPQQERLVMGPTRWPVFVLKDTGDKAKDGKDWASKFRPPVGKAADAMQQMPDYKKVTSWRLGTKLTEGMVQQLQQLLDEQPEVWAWSEEQIGRMNATAHSIDTGDVKPLKQRAYRLSNAEDHEVDKQVNRWLQAGVVVPSQSPWASPVVLVPKPPIDPNDPTEEPRFRLCVDFRKLNALTKTDSFPLPIIQDALDTLGSARHFSIIDLRSAFLQLPLHPDDCEKTAFVTKQGLFEFTVLPFGLKNSPSIFQRLMHQVLGGLLGHTCCVFLDDIIVFSTTWEEHLQHLRELFSRLHEHNLRAHPGKSVIGTDELKYLGHIINAEGNTPDPAKLQAVASIQPPSTVTELRAFLGLVGYYRRFIPRFATIASPLHCLLQKDSVGEWTEECQQAFDNLKKRLLEPPILKRPTPEDEYVLQTDWSQQAVAAVLCQHQDGREHPIAYASKSLNHAERNYSATEGECLAIVWACKYFRQYLYGKPFVLQTDHSALKWLMETRDLTGRLARWSLKLQEYTFEVRYRPGASNANADALSRLPVLNSDVLPVLRDRSNDSSLRYPSDSHVTVHMCTSSMQEIPSPQTKRPGRVAPKKGEEEKTANKISRKDQDQDVGAAKQLMALATPESEDTADPDFEAEDSRSESVETGMSCEVCSLTNRDSDMLVCESCNRGYHTFCLRPRLFEVPSESWFCGDCGGESQRLRRTVDITLDEAVVYCIQHGHPHYTLGDVAKKRIRKRAANDSMNSQGIIMRKATKQYPERVVPKMDLRTECIKFCHELGHFGILRTASMVSERYYWGGIVQDCKEFIKNCSVCKLEHSRFTLPQTLQSIPVTDLSFQRVGIDLVGPLPTSTAGNRFIVVCMDYLTKWPEVAALPNKQASTVRDFFMRDVIARHGCPKVVLSDNGSEFFGEFDKLLQESKIDHRLTSPSHPQANGLVEKFNGTLVTALRKCAADNIHDWDLAIPQVLLGYRSSVQASTRYSPFYMLYARTPLLPTGHADTRLDLEEHSLEQAADQLLEKTTTLKEVRQAAVLNIEKAQEKQKRDYKVKRRHVEPTTLKAGDLVVIKTTQRRNKLTPGAGPDVFQIHRFNNEEKTVVIVRDASVPPKFWRENVSNLALYTAIEDDTSEVSIGDAV